ncbi:YfiT family bacillithiol transferase [Zhouia amylolytica]|uniref:YfiT family bacillithiol transferase n=1 Tax=Zhouia amylolytica TaxID=376730 RepID=UPI0020CE77C4|nr:putative metal-dependent hydrolase [Zhouia amylolytica]MCQ0111912.1 putative metal-dependent hydrolase [Zhouia amylolytica]
MTTAAQLELLKYPIGKYNRPSTISETKLAEWIGDIEALPSKLNNLVSDFTEQQLDTPYRVDGWTVRQVVHHLVDSHVNSYVRYKWTLTEDKPTIKAYHEDRWAELDDYKAPIDTSLQMLEALHKRWVYLLKRLTKDDLSRTFIHPEHNTEISLAVLTSIYSWHCRHHFAHIEHLAKRKGWV